MVTKKNPHSYPKLPIMALYGNLKIQLKFRTIERFKSRQYLPVCAIWYTYATKKGNEFCQIILFLWHLCTRHKNAGMNALKKLIQYRFLSIYWRIKNCPINLRKITERSLSNQLHPQGWQVFENNCHFIPPSNKLFQQLFIKYDCQRIHICLFFLLWFFFLVIVSDPNLHFSSAGSNLVTNPSDDFFCKYNTSLIVYTNQVKLWNSILNQTLIMCKTMSCC